MKRCLDMMQPQFSAIAISTVVYTLIMEQMLPIIFNKEKKGLLKM